MHSDDTEKRHLVTVDGLVGIRGLRWANACQTARWINQDQSILLQNLRVWCWKWFGLECPVCSTRCFFSDSFTAHWISAKEIKARHAERFEQQLCSMAAAQLQMLRDRDTVDQDGLFSVQRTPSDNLKTPSHFSCYLSKTWEQLVGIEQDKQDCRSGRGESWFSYSLLNEHFSPFCLTAESKQNIGCNSTDGVIDKFYSMTNRLSDWEERLFKNMCYVRQSLYRLFLNFKKLWQL